MGKHHSSEVNGGTVTQVAGLDGVRWGRANESRRVSGLCQSEHMTDIPEGGRQASYILLDAVSTWDTTATDDTNSAAMNLALTRMNEVEAFTATLDDNDQLSLDASNLLGGTIVSMNWLIEQLAQERHQSRHSVIMNLREFLAT